MGFKDAVISCYQKNYVGFTGRAPRSEYWFFVLSYVLLATAACVIAIMLGGGSAIFAALGLVFFGILLPSLAVQVRRLHDTNASGWWLLLALIPYLGGLIMVVWFCIPGTKGENRFGADPLNRTDVLAFE